MLGQDSHGCPRPSRQHGVPAPVPGLPCARAQRRRDAGRAARSSGATAQGCGHPGVTVAPCRGAETRSQWVFWSLPASSRQTCCAAALLSLGTPDPCSSPAAARHRRHLPAVPGCAAPPGCSRAFVPAQHIGISSRAAETGRSREEAAAIFNLPDQHPATSTHLGTTTCTAPRVPPLHEPVHASHRGDGSHQPTPVALPAAPAAGTSL